MKLSRMVTKLPDEIDHVTVRIARAEERDEPEHRRRNDPRLCVRCDVSLDSGLRCAVEGRLNRKSSVLRRRHDRALAIDGPRRRKKEPADASEARCLEHVVRCDDILLKISSRVPPAEAYVSVRREMHARIGAGDEFGKSVRRAVAIALDDLTACSSRVF